MLAWALVPGTAHVHSYQHGAVRGPTNLCHHQPEVQNCVFCYGRGKGCLKYEDISIMLCVICVALSPLKFVTEIMYEVLLVYLIVQEVLLLGLD